MSEDIKPKDRPGDQPLPVPNDGPSMHDLVCADLEARWTARLSPGIVSDMQARKQLGLERYGVFSRRITAVTRCSTCTRSLLDAAVYAKQVQVETADTVCRGDIDRGL